MNFSMTLTGQIKQIAERGPRYCVTASSGTKSYLTFYFDTASQAEAKKESLEDEGGYNHIRVHLPDIVGFDIRLEEHGKTRKAAMEAAEQATRVLKAAVIRAAEVGRAEAEIARSAGVDRMTVRKWLGK